MNALNIHGDTRTFVVFLIMGCVISALLCASLIVLLRPFLIRYALARPNARSSHKVPTPQGGGIAVLLSFLCVCGLLVVVSSYFTNQGFPFLFRAPLSVVFALVPLAILGGVDDIYPLPAWFRFLIQILLCGIVVFFNSGETFRVFPIVIPLLAEQIFLVLCAVWFVNLVNFMDGLDWMTVAECVPIFFMLSLIFVYLGAFQQAYLAILLLGSMLGFAYFNKPVAQLFLGDVGSLPLGLLVGFLLLSLAQTGTLTAALLLPLYYLCDATITLVRRFLNGKKIWEAHREHFYQQATDHGFSVCHVVSLVFILNCVLGLLAAATFYFVSPLAHGFLFILGGACVGSVLKLFATPRQKTVFP